MNPKCEAYADIILKGVKDILKYIVLKIDEYFTENNI